MRLTTLGLAGVLLLAGCSGSGSGSDSGSDSDPGSERPASATTTCRGSIGDEEVAGDLVVPRKRTCRLDGTTVRGRVTVSYGATLVAREVRLEEGVSAHSFERVELVDVTAADSPRITDFVLDGGGDVVVRDGPTNGHYYVLDNSGRVEIAGMSLDLGRVHCSGNTRRPVVRDISGETPGVLQGQCAGLRNFGDSDF